MKRFCSLLLLAIFSSAVVMAADEKDKNIGVWTETRIDRTGSSFIGYYDKNLTDIVGLYALVNIGSDGYRQAYAGPKWKPLSWLEVGVGIGKENIQSSVRRNFFFDANWEKVNVFGTFENGGSGPWHKVTVTYKLTEKVSAGVMYQTDLGFGPRLEYTVKKDVQLLGAVLHDHATGNTTPTIAINISF